MLKNIFDRIPDTRNQEFFEDILSHKNIKIERITSSGQTTPENQPYIQENAEWVIIIKGKAKVLFCDSNEEHSLDEGDFLFIPPHCSHRVTYTDQDTIWLAIHIF